MTPRRFSRVLLSCMSAILCLGGVLGFVPQARTLGQAPAATIEPSHGRTFLNAQTARHLQPNYTGEADVVAALGSRARPVSLALADFDADGAPDLVAGYTTANSGIITLTRGNPDAFAPTDTSLYQKAMQGQMPATFMAAAAVYAVPGSPDFLATGDFDRDGNKDVLVGTIGGGLYLLKGDGHGNLGTAIEVPLPGQVVTALDVAPDGHVAVSLDGTGGPTIAVLAPSKQGFKTLATYPLSARGESVAWATLGGGLDLAVGAGSNVTIVYGALSANAQTETVPLSYGVRALAAGVYIWNRDERSQISVLGEDGTVHILQHGTLDTRPLTTADIPGRRAALRARGLPQDPFALGSWTEAKQLPVKVAAPPRAGRPLLQSSPLAGNGLMVADAAQNQLKFLDASGRSADPLDTVAFSGTPVAALVTPTRINGTRAVVTLTADQAAPTVIDEVNLTLNVNTTADIDSVDACTTSVTTPPATLSLREAVCIANNNAPDTSTINLPAGTYDLTSLETGELQVGIETGYSLSIIGAASTDTIIQQTDGKDRIIEQDPDFVGGINVTVENVTVQQGTCGASGIDCTYGGGFMLGGGPSPGDNITLTNVVVSHNTAGDSTLGENGGAMDITDSGTYNFTNCTFSDNTAVYHGSPQSGGGPGGAFYLEINASSGNMTVTDCAFTNNTAEEGGGGAIYSWLEGSTSTTTISGSTFTGNSALDNGSTNGAFGGAIVAEGDMTISNSRIAGNTAADSGAFGTGLWTDNDSPLSVVAINNWWGCNGGPGASGCNTVYTTGNGSLTTSPWLVLSTTAGSTQVDSGETTGLTADLTHNNLGATGFSVPTGTPVTFGGTLDSSVNPTSTTLTSGTATSTYTAGSTAGAGSGTATVDNQTASVTIDVVAGTSTSAAVDDAGTGNAWSGTETAGASAYATASVTPSGSGPTPTGNLTYTFYLGSTCTSTTVGTSTVTLSGGSVPRSTTVGPLGAGTYSLSASYAGDSYHAGSSSTCSSFIVNKVQPAVTVTPGQSRINSAQALSVTVSVSGGSGNPTPTGSVTLSSGSYTSSPTALSAGSAAINVPAGSLAVGSDTLTATYAPDAGSSSTYNGATGTAPVTEVQAIGSCTTANPNPNPNPESFAAVGDFNGDCRSDILWHNSSTEQVYEWLMNGTTFTSSGSPGSLTSEWVIQDAGDFNADGKADILWRNSTTGEVVIWLMNGTTMTSSTSLGNVSSDWSIAGVGDFNGDGYADILWQNTSGELYLWLMSGTTIAGGGIVGNVSSGWNIAGIGDFNADGDADILWRNSTTGQVYVWLMNGTTITSMGSPGTPSSDWGIAGVGDFDGNGTSDILWRNNTTGEAFIWFMNGTTFTSSGSIAFVSSDWVIQGVGDYDGSGRAGILWRNSSTEQVYIWLMNGTTIGSTGSPGTPDAAWQIQP